MLRLVICYSYPVEATRQGAPGLRQVKDPHHLLKLRCGGVNLQVSEGRERGVPLPTGIHAPSLHSEGCSGPGSTSGILPATACPPPVLLPHRTAEGTETLGRKRRANGLICSLAHTTVATDR